MKLLFELIKTLFLHSFKERGPKPARPPPRPQIKTCPPVSRIFKRRPELTSAQSVTFLDSAKSSSLYEAPLRDSTVYDSGKKASYFEQVIRNFEKFYKQMYPRGDRGRGWSKTETPLDFCFKKLFLKLKFSLKRRYPRN